jgi:hypothetical protein
MAAQDKFMEEYEDALFTILMSKVAEEEGAKMLLENERLKADPDFTIPEEVDKRCLDTINRAFHEQKSKTTLHSFWRGFQKVSAAVFAAILLFSGVCVAFRSVRTATRNLLIQASDVSTHMSFDLESAPDSESIKSLSDGYYKIGEVPDGFTQIDRGSSNHSYWECYADEYNRTITFSVAGGVNLVQSIDTEDADVVENIEINGNKGLFVTKGDTIHIALGDEEHKIFVDIVGKGLTKEDMLNIANSLMYIE